jgi:hypothetical protein
MMGAPGGQDDWDMNTSPSTTTGAQKPSNIKSIKPIPSTATTTAPTPQAPPIAIAGLGGLKTTPKPANTRGAQIAAKQARETAEGRINEAKDLYAELKKANTGKGTFMPVPEWNDKLTELNAMLSALPPDQRAKITGEQPAAPSGYDTEGR